jgi:hypothetical protein
MLGGKWRKNGFAVADIVVFSSANVWKDMLPNIGIINVMMPELKTFCPQQH